MMKKPTIRALTCISFTVLFILHSYESTFGQRYLEEVFDNVDISENIVYGGNATAGYVYNGAPVTFQNLTLDVYQPSGDTANTRPLILVLHSGRLMTHPLNGVTSGFKNDSAVVELCLRYAKMGYVTASCEYRLGWNPTLETQEQRSNSFINAIYRGVQDVRTAARFFRRSIQETDNPWGIDGEKFVILGVGDGGFISLATATIDEYSDLNIPKFILTDGTPMIIETINGNPDATIYGIDPVTQDTLCYPNHTGYSSDFQACINLSGGLADISWLDSNDGPFLSFHSVSDPFSPYTSGDLIAPFVNLPVFEVFGSYEIHLQLAENFENNSAFSSNILNDPFTEMANQNNQGLDGLYSFVPTGFAANSQPWEWWDSETNENNSYGSFLNPLMSSAYANMYIDSIQSYISPRLSCALELSNNPCSSSYGCLNIEACNYDPTALFSDFSCIFPGCIDNNACNYDPNAACDDGSCLYMDGCGICGGTSIAGCTNQTACNYNLDAACDDNSCTFPGCTDPQTVNYDPLAGCDDGSCIPTFGSFGINAPASMLYSDTLEIEVMVNNGQNIYGLFGSLEYDTEHFEFVGSTLGDYLGDEVLASPPVDAAGSIEFGASKLGQQAGSNGDGLFYILQFVPISSTPGTPILVDFSLSASDAFNANGTSGELFLPETQSVELIFEAEVWPGDLNHDGIVDVADILPIGYFYDVTGPERPNASLAWEAQNSPIWGTGAAFPGDGFYRVFADGNGDGVVNLADQVAVGFNIDQIVSLNEESSNLEMLAFAQSTNMLVPISNEVTPAQINIPETETMTVQFTATTSAVDAETLFGFTMSIDLSPLGILAADAEIDFSSSEFGVLNESLITQTYVQGSQLNVAITRTSPNTIVGNILLFELTLPLGSTLAANIYTLPVSIGTANDPSGQLTLLNAEDIQVEVNSSFGCTDSAACNYNPDAIEDNGSCLSVGENCDDNNAETFNDVINDDCICSGEMIVEVVSGCTDLNACNYNVNANQDDGSCFSIGDVCDDNDPTTENDIIQDNCLCEGEEILVVFGCTDPAACNFNEEATVEDESCTYVSTFEITGTNIPQAFSTQNYNYTNTTGSTYQWSITAGVLVSGQGSASIEVVWSSEGGGSISVVETNEAGCVGEEVSFDVVILPTTVDEINSSELLFYPNPASEFIYFEANSEFVGSVYYVYDLQGKITAQGTVNGGVNQLNISKCSSGNYEVIILKENKALRTRFVVE